jgi:hypothetical protein
MHVRVVRGRRDPFAFLAHSELGEGKGLQLPSEAYGLGGWMQSAIIYLPSYRSPLLL